MTRCDCMQMTLDLPSLLVPSTCQHREDVPSIDKAICHRDGKETYTTCHKGICGDPPQCVWDEPDNSPEAVARRLEWMKGHERKGAEE